MELKYSVDMLRVRVKVWYREFAEYVCSRGWVSECANGGFAGRPGVEYYRSTKFKDFRHNFVFAENPELDNKNPFIGGESVQYYQSFWLGYQHNTEKLSENYYLVLEYNPNKCRVMPGTIIFDILERFFKYTDFEVVSCDVAIDIPVNINDLIVCKGKKKVYKIFDYGGDNKTYYLGEGFGRVKVYNKKIESGLSYELTRYEVSCKVGLKRLKISDFESNHKPDKIYYLEGLESGDSSFRCMLWAVINGYSVNELSRDYQKRVKEYMNDKTLLKIDSVKIDECLQEYIKKFNDNFGGDGNVGMVGNSNNSVGSVRHEMDRTISIIQECCSSGKVNSEFFDE